MAPVALPGVSGYNYRAQVEMQDWAYHLLRAGLQTMIWGGELSGGENLPQRGPAVIVANHHAALGPIAVACAIPRRMYPWAIGAMMDKVEAPEYLRFDFVEKSLGLQLPLSRPVARTLSKVTVPLLHSLGCVPVHAELERKQETIDRSVNLLMQGNLLLIFPEDPTLPVNPLYNMTPFKKGFARLGEAYYARTRLSLRFYPVAVHGERRVVRVGKPIAYSPLAAAADERLRIKNVLEEMIHEMYLTLSGPGYVGVTLPR